VLDDYETAPIGAAEKALFRFIEKLNRNAPPIAPRDVDAVKAAGWTDEAVYDAITVCALFNFYNKWIDGTGVSDMPAAAYQATGERLATLGYARQQSPGD